MLNPVDLSSEDSNHENSDNFDETSNSGSDRRETVEQEIRNVRNIRSDRGETVEHETRNIRNIGNVAIEYDLSAETITAYLTDGTKIGEIEIADDWLNYVGVAQPYQRCGIATKLMELAIINFDRFKIACVEESDAYEFSLTPDGEKLIASCIRSNIVKLSQIAFSGEVELSETASGDPGLDSNIVMNAFISAGDTPLGTSDAESEQDNQYEPGLGNDGHEEEYDQPESDPKKINGEELPLTSLEDEFNFLGISSSEERDLTSLTRSKKDAISKNKSSLFTKKDSTNDTSTLLDKPSDSKKENGSREVDNPLDFGVPPTPFK